MGAEDEAQPLSQPASGAAAAGDAGADTGADTDAPTHTGRISRLSVAFRLSVSTLTIVRAGAPRVDARTAGAAMAFAPLVGLGVGAVAAAAGQVADWWTQSALVAAVAAIAALAAVTRALHLDGLADTADGLGADRPADEALLLMKRSDIGAFGVVALILVLALQISTLTAAYTIHRGAVAAIVAAMVGRLAVTAACCGPVPAARPGGLGAWVAGSVRVRTAVAVGVAVAAGSGGLGLIVDPQTAALAAAAVPLGVAGALVLLRRCVLRFGGITGDVLGALVETGAVVALFILALRP